MTERSINPFFRDTFTEDGFKIGLDAVFRLVAAFAEELHGSLDRYTYDDVFSIATGEYLSEEALVGKEPMCDGKRDFGGVLERFFEAHYSLAESSAFQYTFADVIPACLSYGFAVSRLALDVDGLDGLVDIADFQATTPNP